MDLVQLDAVIEAALFASETPLPVERLLQLFEGYECEGEFVDDVCVQQSLDRLSAFYRQRGVELVQRASGYRFQVNDQVAPWVGRLWGEKPAKYSRALLETLALMAYRQPITRGEIEEVRGVTVGSQIIRTLQERNWIKVVGHKDVPGRPALFATTKQFLDDFNLSSLEDLPPLAELKSIEGEQTSEVQAQALVRTSASLDGRCDSMNELEYSSDFVVNLANEAEEAVKVSGMVASLVDDLVESASEAENHGTLPLDSVEEVPA